MREGAAEAAHVAVEPRTADPEGIGLGLCPVCSKPSVFSDVFYRWMHQDGTNNAPCWKLTR